MAKKNILIRKKNGSSWDDLLPITAARNVKCNNGKNVESQFDDMATSIGNKSSLRTSSKNNLVNAINEVFQSGNNVKANTVNALLQIDDSLPLSRNSSWAEIIKQIANVETGYGVGDYIDSSNLEVIPEKKIWESKFHRSGYGSNISSIVTDKYKNIYLDCDYRVIKLNQHGEEIWTFTGHTSWVWSIAIDKEGYIYSCSDDETVRKISPDGKEVWKIRQKAGKIKVDSNGYVYVVDNYNEKLIKLNSDGKEIWSIGRDNCINGISIDINNYIYCGTDDRTVEKIDPNGKMVWEFNQDKSGPSNDYIYSITVDSKKYVYTGNGKTLRKISPDGKEIWQFTGFSDQINCVSVDEKGSIYAGSNDKSVRKVNPEGREVWTYTDINSDITSMMSEEDYIYVGSYDGIVRKILPTKFKVLKI